MTNTQPTTKTCRRDPECTNPAYAGGLCLTCAQTVFVSPEDWGLVYLDDAENERQCDICQLRTGENPIPMLWDPEVEEFICPIHGC